MRVDDQALSYPQMRLIENRFNSGRTMYLGGKSGATRIVAYDKRAEIHASNSKLGTYLEEFKEPVPLHELLRIETRLKPRQLLDQASPLGLLELINMPNPFSKLRVHAVPKNLARAELLAITLARHEGLSRVLDLATFTPAEAKSFLRKLKKAGAPSWWRPEQMWEQQFPVLIHNFLMPLIGQHEDTVVPGNTFDPPNSSAEWE